MLCLKDKVVPLVLLCPFRGSLGGVVAPDRPLGFERFRLDTRRQHFFFFTVSLASL